MKEFSVDVARYKPIGSCKDIVFSLDRMIKDGLSEYLASRGINLELLSCRIFLEEYDDKRQEDFIKICRSNPINYNELEEIKQRQEVLYNSRKNGLYNGREIYKNDDIKRIEREIWHPKRCLNEPKSNRKKVAEEVGEGKSI